MKTALEPIIRWAGSKRKLLSTIDDCLPKTFGKYFEPFFGSGCLYFRLCPERAQLGDFNGDLVSFYRQVKMNPSEVLNYARRLRRGSEYYYKVRAKYPFESDPCRRAGMFLYLNRYCFNAIYRTNRHGAFNVPYGVRTGSFPTTGHFNSVASQLRKAKLVCGDFEHSLENTTAGDFVYLDPPYAYTQRRDRGEYGSGSFRLADLTRLGNALERLNQKGVLFLLSYVACREMAPLVKNFRVRRVPVKRCIASLASARCSVNELLVSNY